MFYNHEIREPKWTHGSRRSSRLPGPDSIHSMHGHHSGDHGRSFSSEYNRSERSQKHAYEDSRASKRDQILCLVCKAPANGYRWTDVTPETYFVWYYPGEQCFGVPRFDARTSERQTDGHFCSLHWTQVAVELSKEGENWDCCYTSVAENKAGHILLHFPSKDAYLHHYNTCHLRNSASND